MTARFSSFRPLRNRAFATVWASALVSNVGSWMQTIAVGSLVTETTGRAGWTGLVAAAAFVPIGLLGPVGGALADRVDRRKLMLVTTIAEAVLATLLALLYAADLASPAVVSLVVFGGGAAAGLGFPAYQSMLPDMVPAEDLLGAVSLGAAQYNFGRVIGPALAGLVIHFGSYGWAFAINAASFIGVVIALSTLNVESPKVNDGASLVARIAEGARFAWADLGSKTALCMAFVLALFVSPFIALVPAVAILVHHGDAGTVSLFVAAQGVGAVLGALATTPLADRFGRRQVLVAWMFLTPVAVLIYSAAPNVPAATVAIGFVGLTYIGVFAGLNVVLQVRAPAEYRGRLISLFFGVVGILYPIGATIQGWAGDRTGVRGVTAAGAAVMYAVVLVVAIRRPDALDQLGERDELVTTSPRTGG